MILNFKGGCIASGRVTKSGGVMTFIGDRATPKYKFSIQVSNERDESGEWHSQYLDCEFFGKAAESAPEIHGGDVVLCAGKLETREWTGRDGEPRTSTTLKCGFAVTQNAGGGRAPKAAGKGVYVYPSESDFAEEDGEDYELPF